MPTMTMGKTFVPCFNRKFPMRLTVNAIEQVFAIIIREFLIIAIANTRSIAFTYTLIRKFLQ